jgi:hypothetical protein
MRQPLTSRRGDGCCSGDGRASQHRRCAAAAGGPGNHQGASAGSREDVGHDRHQPGDDLAEDAGAKTEPLPPQAILAQHQPVARRRVAAKSLPSPPSGLTVGALWLSAQQQQQQHAHAQQQHAQYAAQAAAAVAAASVGLAQQGPPQQLGAPHGMGAMGGMQQQQQQQPAAAAHEAQLLAQMQMQMMRGVPPGAMGAPNGMGGMSPAAAYLAAQRAAGVNVGQQSYGAPPPQQQQQHNGPLGGADYAARAPQQQQHYGVNGQEMHAMHQQHGGMHGLGMGMGMGGPPPYAEGQYGGGGAMRLSAHSDGKSSGASSEQTAQSRSTTSTNSSGPISLNSMDNPYAQQQQQHYQEDTDQYADKSAFRGNGQYGAGGFQQRMAAIGGQGMSRLDAMQQQQWVAQGGSGFGGLTSTLSGVSSASGGGSIGSAGGYGGGMAAGVS